MNVIYEWIGLIVIIIASFILLGWVSWEMVFKSAWNSAWNYYKKTGKIDIVLSHDQDHICCWNDVKLNGTYCTTCGRRMKDE